MRARRTATFLVLAVASAAGTARGHDFWIAPSTHRPLPGEVVGLRLMVGDGFRGEPYARNPAHLVRFVAAGPGGVVDLPGRPGADPAGRHRVDRPGLYVVAYLGGPTRIEIEAEKFRSYLEEVGLDDVLLARDDLGESDEPGRELYHRCAKTVLWSSGAEASGFDRHLGLTLEIVPESNPLGLAPGDELRLQVLYEGRPLEGLLLRSFRKAAVAPTRPVRTDGNGRARIRLDGAGQWLVSAVYMVEAKADSGADWVSYWTSLTFEVAPPR